MRRATSRRGEQSPRGGPDEQPLYRRLVNELRARIASGHYPIDGALPTEAELCQEFAVSRYTVREALRRLVDLGLVARKQGSGSQVVSNAPPGIYVHQMRSLSELFQYALETRYEIEDLKPVLIDEEAAALVGVAPGTTWLRIDGVRRGAEGRETICYTTVYVASRFSPLVEEMRATRGPIYALIETRGGERIAEAVQEIASAPAPRALAPVLGIEPRAPAMRVIRRYLGDDGGLLVASINWYPPERFVYRTHLKRDEIGGEG